MCGIRLKPTCFAICCPSASRFWRGSSANANPGACGCTTPKRWPSFWTCSNAKCARAVWTRALSSSAVWNQNLSTTINKDHQPITTISSRPVMGTKILFRLLCAVKFHPCNQMESGLIFVWFTCLATLFNRQPDYAAATGAPVAPNVLPQIQPVSVLQPPPPPFQLVAQQFGLSNVATAGLVSKPHTSLEVPDIYFIKLWNVILCGIGFTFCHQHKLWIYYPGL